MACQLASTDELQRVRADVSELFCGARIVPIAAHRSLIAFAGWWSLFHASVMAIQTLQA